MVGACVQYIYVRDQAVRVASGRSVRDMARLVRVSRQTIERYEVDPMCIGRRKRARILAFYSMLRRQLADLDALAERLQRIDEAAE